MSEKAILPLNQARVTAGYKNKSYLRTMGFSHYGIDMADDNRKELEVYAPFEMVIKYAGWDELMGYTIIAVSTEPIEIHAGKYAGQAKRLTVRMAHLQALYVKAGDKVKPEHSAIARYGDTGKYGGSPHLHIELDTDIRNPNYSPTLSGHSNIWKAGTDSTINPMDALKVDSQGARGVKQTLFYAVASGDWIQADDRVTLDYSSETIYKAKGV